MVRKLALLAALLTSTSAHAQFGALPWTPINNAGGGYIGPGDIQSGADYYIGVRAYSSATRGQALFDLRRTSDSTACTGVPSDATTGKLDLTVATPCPGTTTASAWCAATTCVVSKAYDDSGSSHPFLQVTAANQPTLTASCGGLVSIPCITCAGSQWLDKSGGSTINQPYTYSVVAVRTATFTVQNTIMGSYAASTSTLVFDSTANKIQLYGGTALLVTGIADNSFHAFQGIFNNASSTLYIDGTANNGTAGAGALAASNTICSQTGHTNNMTGSIMESMIYPIGFSGGIQSSMNNNQRAYGGF